MPGARSVSLGRVALAQLQSPLLLLLVFAAAVSAITREWIDAGLVLLIVLVSVGIGALREYKGQAAAGVVQRVPADEVVVGDIITLAAGSLVPADAVVLEASDCHVNEAVLTGEAFGVEKTPGIVAAATPLARRTNSVYQGSNVQSGTARCLVVATGSDTEYGAIAQTLRTAPPETEFDRGLRRFGYLLVKMMVLITAVVFTVHLALERPALETLLFAIALAVGLSPELLPAILSVNLARGAAMMASRGVLVRHLSAIENLGSMDVLCTDKTGTLTEGVVWLEGAYDPSGARSSRVLELGAINAFFETGLRSALDDAILSELSPPGTGLRKLAEVPFDFVRKRVSVVRAPRACSSSRKEPCKTCSTCRPGWRTVRRWIPIAASRSLGCTPVGPGRASVLSPSVPASSPRSRGLIARVLTGAELDRLSAEALLHAASTPICSRRSTLARRNGSSRRCGEADTWWASSVTASTTRRPCTPPTRACRSMERSTWRARRRTSSCSSATWACSGAASRPAGPRSRTR
jgi:hypothetical protein